MITYNMLIFCLGAPRDLTDEILLQLIKQEQDPDPNSVLSQLSESHLVQIIQNVFSGKNRRSVTDPY